MPVTVYPAGYGAILPAYYPTGRVSGNTMLVFQDTFTDADSTLLTAHTPDVDTVGDGWTLRSGLNSFSITSNAVSLVGAVTLGNVASIGISEFIAKVDLTLGNASTEAVFSFGGNDPAWLASQRFVYLRNADIRILEQNSTGGTFVRGSVARGTANGVFYYKFESGNITVYDSNKVELLTAAVSIPTVSTKIYINAFEALTSDFIEIYNTTDLSQVE